VLKVPRVVAVLRAAATLTPIAPDLLAAGALPGLWDTPEVTVQHIVTYFSGSHVVTMPREGYDETLAIPRAEAGVVEQAIRTAVKEGTLWLTAGQASIYKEDIPAGLLDAEAVLQAPPQAVSALDAVHLTLPNAQPGATTTAQAIADALSARAGKPLSWSIVRDAISSALRAQYLELAGGATWPCDATATQSVILQVPVPKAPGQEKPPTLIHEPTGTGMLFGPKAGTLTAQANLGPIELQELGEQASVILKEADGLDVTFHITIEFKGLSSPSPHVVARINQVLQGISADLRLV
jgi:hypothetical protein